MQTNSGMTKIIKTNKELDTTKPKYKQGNKHDWQRTDTKRQPVGE